MQDRLVVFRCAGGRASGLGHLLRCVAIAEAFVARGARCRFAGEAPEFLAAILPGGLPLAVPGGLADWSDQGFRDQVQQADLLVTDSYDIGPDWQARSPVPVLAVTDPPLQPQACRLLLLPTAFGPAAGPDCLTAPEHALVRAPFRERRTGPRTGDRLLVSCGGGDDRGLTARILEALASQDALRALPVTVVLGVTDPETAQQVGRVAAQLPRAEIVERVVDMPALIARHDIAIGTPAGSALERCCLGLAQVLVPIAENQQALGAALAAHGAAIVLASGAEARDIAQAVTELLADAGRQRAIAERGYALIDGRGAERVVKAVEQRIFAPS